MLCLTYHCSIYQTKLSTSVNKSISGIPLRFIKAAVRYGTFKLIDFMKRWNIKGPVVPRSLILWSKLCFRYLIKKFVFSWENIIHKQQCVQMCRGAACKQGRQESAISKASMHADHPPMCLKMLCKCKMIEYCNASLYKKVRHYFCHDFVLFTLNSKLSLVFYYVNLSKREVLMTFCVSISTL